jgi:hypothetical protein
MRMSCILAASILILGGTTCLADEGAPQLPPPSVLAAPPHAIPESAARCHGHDNGESHFHHLLEWAFYHPAAKCCCHCLPRPVPCCTPPLYTWFPCQGFGGCGPEGCTSCGEAAGPCKSDCYRFFHHGKD